MYFLKSPPHNKYAEGYPNKENIEVFSQQFPDYKHFGKTGRYYGGCQYIDQIELYCIYKWQQVFGVVGQYHVNVQPHSGSQANMEAYDAVLKPGDTILSMSLDAGGHLTHASGVSFVSKKYNVITYGLNDNGYLDYKDLKEKIVNYHPQLILAGASSYSREIDYQRIKKIIMEETSKSNYCPYFMVDMAHVAGLIATGLHQSPFGIADIITTTTHKTLRGPRGGLIFCKPELAKQIDSAVFPRNQGGPLEHVIAAKAQAAVECLDPSFEGYMNDVKLNAVKMADAFKAMGYNIVSNGTDNHMFILDLRGMGWTGLEAQKILEENNITVNKNALWNDPLPPSQASGIRIGTPAMTTLGWKPLDFIKCAAKIDEILKEKH